MLQKINKSERRQRLLEFCRRDGLMWIIIALLFIAYLCAMLYLGAGFTIGSDDLSYVKSGIFLKNTGVITMHDPPYPSAQIMPGLPVLIAGLSLIFGEGNALWLAIKLIWITLASLSGVFVYKSVRLYAPWWCASLSLLPFFGKDFVGTCNVPLTETPYIFLFCILLYCTLKMTKSDKSVYAWVWLAAFMLALMFRANILTYPFFAAAYLLLNKCDKKLLLKRCAVLVLSIICFVIPWSIRNYKYFNEFVPFTYGTGHALWSGTYQGFGYPTDDVDAEAIKYAEAMMAEKYPETMSETEAPKLEPHFYLLKEYGYWGKYRIKAWLNESPLTFFFSYLIVKPYYFVTRTYFPVQKFGPSRIGYFFFMTMTAAALITSLVKRKHLNPMLFLMAVYAGNVFIHCTSFAITRYNLPLIPVLMILLGIGYSFLLPESKPE